MHGARVPPVATAICVRAAPSASGCRCTSISSIEFNKFKPTAQVTRQRTWHVYLNHVVRRVGWLLPCYVRRCGCRDPCRPWRSDRGRRGRASRSIRRRVHWNCRLWLVAFSCFRCQHVSRSSQLSPWTRAWLASRVRPPGPYLLSPRHREARQQGDRVAVRRAQWRRQRVCNGGVRSAHVGAASVGEQNRFRTRLHSTYCNALNPVGVHQNFAATARGRVQLR